MSIFFFCLLLESVSDSQMSNIPLTLLSSRSPPVRLDVEISLASRTAEFTAVQDCHKPLHELFLSVPLSRLQLQSCSPPGGIAEILAAHENLEELSLICLSLDESDIHAILQLENLRSLDLRGCRMMVKELNRLFQISNLEVIDLRGVSLRRREIESLQIRCPERMLLIVDR